MRPRTYDRIAVAAIVTVPTLLLALACPLAAAVLAPLMVAVLVMSFKK